MDRILVVGESFYQNNFLALFPNLDKDGADNAEMTATLVLEDDNPKDSQAVRVDINGLTVGYLDRQTARRYRSGRFPKTCPAYITGGFVKDNRRANFGVSLDLELDPQPAPAAQAGTDFHLRWYHWLIILAVIAFLIYTFSL